MKLKKLKLYRKRYEIIPHLFIIVNKKFQNKYFYKNKNLDYKIIYRVIKIYKKHKTYKTII